MRQRLDTFKDNVYSQFGEDGCLAHVLECIGVQHRVVVDFGAGDGESCSNTARLWRDEGWRAVLIEPDPKAFEALEGNARLFDTVRLQTFVRPIGPDSIGEILKAQGIEGIDVMSIDVDGDDLIIMENLTVRPRVIVIEFNPTVPPHMVVRQNEVGGTFGASLLAIARVGEAMGYRFVGATYCNAFLVSASEAGPLQTYETEPTKLFEFGHYTYAVTDFAGRLTLVGQSPPWGVRDTYVLPLEVSAYRTSPSDNAQYVRRGFESLWGPAVWLSPHGLTQEALTKVLSHRPRLVCVDLTEAAAEAKDWMMQGAGDYRVLLVGPVLGLVAP